MTHGLIEVEGAETCLVHVDGIILETGSGCCDMATDDHECVGAPLYRDEPLLAMVDRGDFG